MKRGLKELIFVAFELLFRWYEPCAASARHITRAAVSHRNGRHSQRVSHEKQRGSFVLYRTRHPPTRLRATARAAGASFLSLHRCRGVYNFAIKAVAM